MTKHSLSPLKTQVLSFLSALETREKQYEKINKTLRDIQGDFPHHCSPMDHDIYDDVFNIIDEILGETIASYYFFECRGMKGGGSVTVNDKTYKIRNLADLRRYLERE